MSVYRGYFKNDNAGYRLDEFDVQFVKNANWTIFDTNPIAAASEKLTNGDFATNDFTGWSAGAGWAAGTGAAVHTPGNTATLSQGFSGTVGNNDCYEVTFTISGSTQPANSLVLAMANMIAVNVPANVGVNGSYTIWVYSNHTSSSVVFTPLTGFDGTIDNVSVKRLTAEARVYKCSTTNSVFYFLVEDTFYQYARVCVYESWDAGTHTGSGLNTSSTACIWKAYANSPYVFIINDTRVILLVFNSTDHMQYYLGQLDRVNITLNRPMLVADLSTGNKQGGSVTNGCYRNNYSVWKILKFDTSTIANLYCPFANADAGVGNVHFRTSRGFFIRNSWVISEDTSTLQGQLDGFMCCGQGGWLIPLHDTVIVNGVAWMGVGDFYYQKGFVRLE